MILEGVLTKVRSIFLVLKEYEDRNNTETMQSNSFTCPTSKLAGAGRPVIIVEREQLEFLRELHFPWAKIACLLGISESTLRWRRHNLGLNDTDDNWTTLSGVQNLQVDKVQHITPFTTLLARK